MAQLVYHPWLLFGLLCPASSLYAAGSVDFNKVELWPLSGGVQDGVTVELTANKIISGELAAVDFLTAKYELAFRFEVDFGTRTITRNSLTGESWGAAETRGGFPFADASQPLKVRFTKTPTAWAISVGENGQRMPWFDFKHRTNEDVVYAAVNSGFDEGEIVDGRPGCLVECHPEECMDVSGTSTCKEGACFSRTTAGDSAIAANCSSNKMTGPDGVNCCDGRQLNSIAPGLDPAMVGKWFTVHSDLTMVLAACSSFGSSGDCAAARGLKVQIVNSSSATGMYRVWVVQFYTAASTQKGGDRIDLPPDILARKARQEKVIAIGGKNVAFKFRLDNLNLGYDYYSLITTVEPEAESAGIEKWWFLNMFMTENLIPGLGIWWLSHSQATYQTVARQATLNLYLVDELVDHTPCVDDIWKDSEGNTCNNYTENEWCLDHGVATDSFRTSHPGVNNLDQLRNSSGFHASYTCCLCGGGFHDNPNVSQVGEYLLKGQAEVPKDRTVLDRQHDEPAEVNTI